MTPSLFSTIGFVSVGLAALVPILWGVHYLKRPRGWWCHVALAVAVAAFVCAKLNSNTYVNLIQLDRSAELAAAKAKQEQARETALAAREGDVANVRFAEDGAADRFDEAGMDESERKYYQKLKEDAATPAWQRDKKQRGTSSPDDSLESQIGGKDDAAVGMDTTAVEEESEPEPIIMEEARMQLANRLDGVNLTTIRILMWLGFIIIIIDYLARFNRDDAYLPLPIPAKWAEELSPLPTVIESPAGNTMTLVAVAKKLVQRGDCFVYLSDKPQADLPDTLYRLPGKTCPIDVIRASAPDAGVDDDFVFEGLWHNRACFVVDDAAHTARMFEYVIESLEARKRTRARCRQPVHVVWGMSSSLSEDQQRRFTRAARKTGFSLRVLFPA